MITKRLLRLALGPSYLEETEENPFIKANEAQINRLYKAEGDLLVYVGLSSKDRPLTQDEDSPSGASPRDEHTDGSPDEESSDAVYYPVATVHLVSTIAQWPSTKLMAKAQTYTSPVSGYVGLWRNKGLVSLSIDFLWASLHETLVQSQHNITHWLLYHTVFRAMSGSILAVPLGLFNLMSPHIFFYPILEHSIYRMLDLEQSGKWPILPLSHMYTLSFYQSNALLIAQSCVWKFVEDNLRTNIEIVLGDQIRRAYTMISSRPISANNPLARMVPFFTDLVSSTLAEIGTIPISRLVYRGVALKYGCSLMSLNPSLSTLATAVSVEWALTFAFTKLHEWVSWYTVNVQ